MEQAAKEFSSTQWTVLEGLRAEDESVRRAAAERLAKVYWPPVYAYARRLVRTRDDAAELTQGFFAEVVMGRRLFERADPAQGKLRGLLCAALRHYASDQWRKSRLSARERPLPIDGLGREESLIVDPDPQSAFDRRWALALFEEALRRCEDHFARAGKRGHWRAFELRVLRPATHATNALSCEDAAAACGFPTAAAAAAAVQTVKRRLDALFREVVGETLDSPDDLPEEYRLVRSLLDEP